MAVGLCPTVVSAVRSLTWATYDDTCETLRGNMPAILQNNGILLNLVIELASRAVVSANDASCVSRMCGDVKRFEVPDHGRFRTTLLSQCQSTFGTIDQACWTVASAAGLGALFGGLHGEGIMQRKVVQSCLVKALFGSPVSKEHAPQPPAVMFAVALYKAVAALPKFEAGAYEKVRRRVDDLLARGWPDEAARQHISATWAQAFQQVTPTSNIQATPGSYVSSPQHGVPSPMGAGYSHNPYAAPYPGPSGPSPPAAYPQPPPPQPQPGLNQSLTSIGSLPASPVSQQSHQYPAASPTGSHMNYSFPSIPGNAQAPYPQLSPTPAMMAPAAAPPPPPQGYVAPQQPIQPIQPLPPSVVPAPQPVPVTQSTLANFNAQQSAHAQQAVPGQLPMGQGGYGYLPAAPPMAAPAVRHAPLNMAQLYYEAAVYPTQAQAETAVAEHKINLAKPPQPPQPYQPIHTAAAVNRSSGVSTNGDDSSASPRGRPSPPAVSPKAATVKPLQKTASTKQPEAAPAGEEKKKEPKEAEPVPETDIFGACKTKADKRRLGNLLINKALQSGYNRSYGAARRKMAKFCRRNYIGEADQAVLVEYLNDLFLAGHTYRGLCLKEFVTVPQDMQREGAAKRPSPNPMRSAKKGGRAQDDEIESVMSGHSAWGTETWGEQMSECEMEELSGHWAGYTSSQRLSSFGGDSVASECAGDMASLADTPPETDIPANLDISVTSIDAVRRSCSNLSRSSRASRTSSRGGMKYGRIPEDITIDDRVKVVRSDATENVGTVKYIGFPKFTKRGDTFDGCWIGVCLDEAVGTHDGMVDEERYFYAGEKRGVFVREDKILRQPDGIEGPVFFYPQHLTNRVLRFDIRQEAFRPYGFKHGDRISASRKGAGGEKEQRVGTVIGVRHGLLFWRIDGPGITGACACKNTKDEITGVFKRKKYTRVGSEALQNHLDDLMKTNELKIVEEDPSKKVSKEAMAKVAHLVKPEDEWEGALVAPTPAEGYTSWMKKLWRSKKISQAEKMGNVVPAAKK